MMPAKKTKYIQTEPDYFEIDFDKYLTQNGIDSNTTFLSMEYSIKFDLQRDIDDAESISGLIHLVPVDKKWYYSFFINSTISQLKVM